MTEMSQSNTNQTESFDFKRWYEDIDDFVSDTAQQLNDINRQLGQVGQWKPSASKTAIDDNVAQVNEEPVGEPGSSEERLHALRNRLKARLKNTNTTEATGQNDEATDNDAPNDGS